jgi:glycosyltransferase involved in cell wall biosynthesis
MKSSRNLENSLFKKIKAFWGGAFNVRTYFEIRRMLKDDRPDVVHVHSVYPMFSPSILIACRHAGVPVVMTVHTHNLTCPTWYHLYKGRICEECIGGHEHRCITKNCRNNIFESVGYAFRSSVARVFRLFHDNVTVMIALTPFGKTRLLQAGYSDNQVAVVPNPTAVSEEEVPKSQSSGEYVAFSGRVSPEKGVDILIAAAAQMPDIRFKVAGDGPALLDLKSKAPGNVEFLGRLGFDELLAFYRKARILVAPSLWYEPFGMVVVDSMASGIPVIASRIGGLPFLVEDGVTGTLFEPGNPDELVHQIRRLWENTALSSAMGQAGRQRVRQQYSQNAYYQNLISVYQKAVEQVRTGTASSPLIQISNIGLQSDRIDS